MRLLHIMACAAFFAFIGMAEAAKPQDNSDVYLGNGYPSGPHFNLNIHGKLTTLSARTRNTTGPSRSPTKLSSVRRRTVPL